MSYVNPPGAPEDAGLWAFGPAGRELVVRNAERLLAYLPFFLGGWPFRHLDADADITPDIEISANTAGDIIVSLSGPGGGPAAFDSAFTAASGFAGTLVAAYTARQDDRVCFHAGSALIDGALAVCLGDSGAGKSTLSLQLAAAGYRLFGDDRLVARDPVGGVANGVCLGLMPKARLPLPASADARFREFIAGFTEMRTDDTAYLKLWEGEAAAFEDEAPIAAFFVLDRTAEGGCDVSPLPRADLVRALLQNSYSPHLDHAALVPRMTALASAAPGYRLRYAECADAARAIIETLRVDG